MELNLLFPSDFYGKFSKEYGSLFKNETSSLNGKNTEQITTEVSHRRFNKGFGVQIINLQLKL
jgi:hypothetical protein